jgi:H+/Cl- antiporter ClcA
MGSQLLSWWDIYFYVAGVVAICFGAFAKNGWLKYLRFRDGTQPSPIVARIILIVTGAGGILITYYVQSQGR